MLAIEPGEEVLIPEVCRYMHNICVVLYDSLVEIIKSEEYKEAQSTTISLVGKPDDLEMADTEKLFDWLLACGRVDELTTILTKHVTNAVLSDFLQFVHESLSAAKRSKFSVAYALARKPFLDELLLFEQLLDDSKDFVDRFYLQGSTGLYDPASKKIDRRALTQRVVNKLAMSAMFDVDFIYELRYDKVSKHGLNWISNHAIHIVTADPNYRTSDREMNFVFSVTEDYEKYAFHYYQNVAFLLFYTAAVVDAIVCPYLSDAGIIKSLKAAKRFLAFMLYTGIVEKERTTKPEQAFEAIGELLRHTCKMCETNIKFDSTDFELFVFENVLLCPTCTTNQFADRKFTAKVMVLGSSD